MGKAYLRGSLLEALTAMLGLTGWALLTWGLMEATGQQWIWKLSLGSLFIGLFGLGTLWHLFKAGLLGLTMDQKDEGATDGSASDGSTEGSTDTSSTS